MRYSHLITFRDLNVCRFRNNWWLKMWNCCSVLLLHFGFESFCLKSTTSDRCKLSCLSKITAVILWQKFTVNESMRGTLLKQLSVVRFFFSARVSWVCFYLILCILSSGTFMREREKSSRRNVRCIPEHSLSWCAFNTVTSIRCV